MIKKRIIIFSLITALLVSTVIPQTKTMMGQVVYAAEENTDTVKSVQEALNNAGYDCGTPDGVFGSNTQAAIQQYQEDNGLTVSGSIDDELLSALSIIDDSNTEEVINGGVPLATFVERYNEAIDYYNKLAAIDNYDIVSNISVDSIEAEVSFCPDDRLTITLNPNIDNKENINTFNAHIDDNSLVMSDMIVTAEATCLIYALDVSLNNFSEALDVYDLILGSKTMEYNNIEYTVNADNGFTIIGVLNEPEIAEENEANNISEFNSNYGSSTTEFATAIVGNLEKLINDDGESIVFGEIEEDRVDLVYNNSLRIWLAFIVADGCYIITSMPSLDYTQDDASDYVEFLIHLIQASNEGMTDLQANFILLEASTNEGEIYEAGNNTYMLEGNFFVIQIFS